VTTPCHVLVVRLHCNSWFVNLLRQLRPKLAPETWDPQPAILTSHARRHQSPSPSCQRFPFGKIDGSIGLRKSRSSRKSSGNREQSLKSSRSSSHIKLTNHESLRSGAASKFKRTWLQRFDLVPFESKDKTGAPNPIPLSYLRREAKAPARR
jgi:hypothetical protein